MAAKETVLYFSPEKNDKVRRVKSVLVRLGIRIKNITAEQFDEQVGTLSGLVVFPGKWETDEKVGGKERTEAHERKENQETDSADFTEEILVLCNFTNTSLDRLFRELKKSDAAVDLKAVLTKTNCAWTFRRLYEEVRKEHEAMKGGKGKNEMQNA